MILSFIVNVTFDCRFMLLILPEKDDVEVLFPKGNYSSQKLPKRWKRVIVTFNLSHPQEVETTSGCEKRPMVNRILEQFTQDGAGNVFRGEEFVVEKFVSR